MGLHENEQHLDVCKGCGDMFVRDRIALCQTCATNEHRRFNLVREYLRNHRGKSVGEIAVATGLGRAEVSKYIMQGRLIEIDPETGRRLEDVGPVPLSDMDALLKKQAQRMFQAEEETRRGRSTGSQPVDPGFRKPEDDADDSDRVRYVRRQRRKAD